MSTAQRRAPEFCGGRYAIAPGDGNSFWHAVKRAADRGTPVDLLRQEVGGLPGRWADEGSVRQTVRRESLQLALLSIETDSPRPCVGGPWNTMLGEEGGVQIELIMWTVGGEGLYFEVLSPDILAGGSDDDATNNMRRLEFDDCVGDGAAEGGKRRAPREGGTVQ